MTTFQMSTRETREHVADELAGLGFATTSDGAPVGKAFPLHITHEPDQLTQVIQAVLRHDTGARLSDPD